jgi:IS5 family transposase
MENGKNFHGKAQHKIKTTITIMSTIEALTEFYERKGYTGKEAVEEAKAELARQDVKEKERRQHELELAQLNGK